ncbi:MAG: flavin reductase family protein [Promethearchaeota archaeon]|nr:MAG: flavin reductase family protein [Candidatus Lokiarchaeota archaeon]
MLKKIEKGNSDLYPNPVALISAEYEGKESIITLAWVGTVCSSPPMVSISIRPSRFSYELVKSSREFVINIPTSSMIKQINLCGSKSGKTTDKWRICGFTKQLSKTISVPAIAECPVNMECKVTQVISLGSHEMFIAEVTQVHKDPDIHEKDGEMVVFARGKGGNYGKISRIM